MKLFLAVFALASIALGASIQDIDFKNFSYPFVYPKYILVPDKLRWMPRAGAKPVALRDGRHTFLCSDDPCYLLSLDHVDFGHIDGLPATIALVLIGFHTGGTAQWQYLYVVADRIRNPQVVAWLETGSRGYMGLRGFAIDRGVLVLVVNDPDKRQGDCCSTGTITYRYRWHDASFRQIGSPVRADDTQ